MPARCHRQLVAALLLSLLSGVVRAQVTTPTAGSAERRAILDGLRTPVEKRLRKKVVFKVDHLKVEDGWAFLRGVPQQPGGKAMDYRDTEYAGAIRQGIFDDWICALLRKQGRRWEVVTFIIGATDVPWVDWGERYKAPPGIFESSVARGWKLRKDEGAGQVNLAPSSLLVSAGIRSSAARLWIRPWRLRQR